MIDFQVHAGRGSWLIRDCGYIVLWDCEYLYTGFACLTMLCHVMILWIELVDLIKKCIWSHLKVTSLLTGLGLSVLALIYLLSLFTYCWSVSSCIITLDLHLLCQHTVSPTGAYMSEEHTFVLVDYYGLLLTREVMPFVPIAADEALHIPKSLRWCPSFHIWIFPADIISGWDLCVRWALSLLIWIYSIQICYSYVFYLLFLVSDSFTWFQN